MWCPISRTKFQTVGWQCSLVKGCFNRDFTIAVLSSRWGLGFWGVSGEMKLGRILPFGPLSKALLPKLPQGLYRCFTPSLLLSVASTVLTFLPEHPRSRAMYSNWTSPVKWRPNKTRTRLIIQSNDPPQFSLCGVNNEHASLNPLNAVQIRKN